MFTHVHSAVTLPDSEGHFQVFSAPSDHSLVVASDLPVIVPGHGEKPSSHGWGRGGVGGFPATLALVGLPGEVTRPCEPSHRDVDTPWRAVEL